MCTYGIDSISEDALVKNFYRWREAFSKMWKKTWIFTDKKRSEKQATKVGGLSVTSDLSEEKCPQSVRDVSDKNNNKWIHYSLTQIHSQMNKELSTVIHVHDHATAEDTHILRQICFAEPTLANTAPGLLYDRHGSGDRKTRCLSSCLLRPSCDSEVHRYNGRWLQDRYLETCSALVTITTLLNNVRLTVVCNTNVNPYL